jgi:hypothetical protein
MRRLAAVFLCLLALSACKSDNDTSDGSSGTTTTTTAADPATTAAPTTIPSGPAQTPQGAADGLFAAWKANDQEDASRYARPPAITKLFAHPYSNDGTKYDKQPCSPQGGQFNCAWTYPGGSLQMTVENWPGGGFVVDSVIWVAD